MSINGDVIAEPVYEENDYKDSWGSMKGLVYNEGLSVVIENGKIIRKASEKDQRHL